MGQSLQCFRGSGACAPTPVGHSCGSVLRRAAVWLALLFTPLVWGAPADPQQGDLRWGVVDWPPGFLIPPGKLPATIGDLGEGQFDRIVAELAQRMPQYSHRVEILNSTRMWHVLGEGQGLCSGPFRKTPDRLKSVYMTPVVRVVPLSLVVRADQAHEFVDATGSVSLVELLSKTRFRGRLEVARSYGASLDAMLNGAGGLPRDPAPRLGLLVELVAAGRIDFTLEYAYVAEYLRHSGRLHSAVTAIPLKEVSDWETAYMACPRTPWGLAAITAIDAAIRQASTTSSFREAYLRWLPPAVKASHKAATEMFYNARAQGGAQIE